MGVSDAGIDKREIRNPNTILFGILVMNIPGGDGFEHSKAYSTWDVACKILGAQHQRQADK